MAKRGNGTSNSHDRYGKPKKKHGARKGAPRSRRDGGEPSSKAAGKRKRPQDTRKGSGYASRAHDRNRTNGSSKAPQLKRTASPEALAICPMAGECGGCSLLGVPYEKQLADKQARIVELFNDAVAPDTLMDPMLGMKEPFHYRDKIASPFAPNRKVLSQAKKQKGKARRSIPRDGIRCGLFAAGTHRIIPIENCPVENPVGRQVIAAVQQLMARFGMMPYDEDQQTGFLRYVVVRAGHESGEVLVTLVTAEERFPGAKNFCRELVKRVPQVTTVVQNVNPQVGNAILGPTEHVLYGPGFILDSLCGLMFRISAHSFYQVNAQQTETLYRTAMEFAGLDDFEAPTVVDAYCGTGTIGLVAASQAPGATVIGVDSVPAAIDDARGNAEHNGIENAEFMTQDATEFMQTLVADARRRGKRPMKIDVLFMDPPRAGSTPAFIKSAAFLEPQRIVYISCNPETQARDAEEFARHGYRIVRMRPVDMFPHTPHIENVALLEKAGE